MLIYNSTRFFKAKGIQKPFTYMVTHGFSDNFATAFVHNRFRKLNLDDVQRLCELLLCTPNDLIQWIPETKDADNPTHPLQSLQRNTKVMDLTRTLHSVPYERLLEIEKLIQLEVNK